MSADFWIGVAVGAFLVLGAIQWESGAARVQRAWRRMTKARRVRAREAGR